MIIMAEFYNKPTKFLSTQKVGY